MSVDSEAGPPVVGPDESANGQGTEPLLARLAELEAEVAQLRDALGARQQIGLITGVLAERFDLTPEQAWRFMVRLSSRTNVKVRQVAELLHAGYFGQLAEEDLAAAALLNEHLPRRGRLPVDLDES